MNRKNEPRDRGASGSSTHYVKEPKSAFEPRPTNTGFQSFLKWFRKNENERLAQNLAENSNCNSHKQYTENGYKIHTKIKENRTTKLTSSNNSPNLDSTISSSSSCDSVFSTTTTSFSFIPPNQYRPFGELSQSEKLIAPGPVTDTYRQRLKVDRNAREKDRQLQLTLRKKYNIFDSDTLASNNSLNFRKINSLYSDRSLPQTSASSNYGTIEPSHFVHRRKSHRRTVSDSSKDKKAGAYVHVKGKRKAPKPPNIADSESNSREGATATGTLSPLSTLGRKKRRAPPPPQSPVTEEVPIVLANGLFDDEEIKAIIGGRSLDLPQIRNSKEIDQTTQSALKMDNEQIDTVPCTDTLRLEKGVLKSNRDTFTNAAATTSAINNDNKTGEKSMSPQMSTSSSISPRPWYKRSQASNKEYAIPFKREVILKTIDKRKHKEPKDDGPQLPEFGFSRNSSLFESFFSRLNSGSSDKFDDVTEKRKSGIMMPNISELDREAALIISKEYQTEKNNKIEESINSTSTAENSQEKQEPQFPKNTINNSECKQTTTTTTVLITTFQNSNDDNNKRQTTADIDQSAKIKSELEQINRQYSAGVNCSVNSESKENINKNDKATKIEGDKNPVIEDKQKINDNLKIPWNCPYCTLENSYWRVICEACERFKPYEIKTITNNDSKPYNNGIVSQMANLDKKTKDQKMDWETKAEKVMKYFRPKLSMNSLSKSASETSVGKTSSIAKGRSTSKKLIDSPKLSVRSKFENNIDIVNRKSSNFEMETNKSIENVSKCSMEIASGSVYLSNDFIPSDEINSRKPLPTIEEMRQARLAKFSDLSQSSIPIQNKTSEAIDKLPNDTTTNESKKRLDNPDELEKEKQKLREMIRAMNAKALAEKYPILQKSTSLTESEQSTKTQMLTLSESDLTERKQVYSARPKSEISDTKQKQLASRNLLSLDLNQYTTNGQQLGGAIKKVFNRKQQNIDDDKEITDNLNYSNIKLERDGIMKISSFSQTINDGLMKKDYLILPSPIQELNENDENIISPIKSNYYIGLKEDLSISMYDNYLDDSMGHIDKDLKHLEEISQQLNTQKGLEDFKATLKASNKKINNTNTLALNKILKNLETAIAAGEHELAAKLAMDLAKMKVSLSVTKQTNNNFVCKDEGEEKNPTIIVDVYIRDSGIEKDSFQLSLATSTTIHDLKQKISKEFNISENTQRWMLNNQFAISDSQILSDFGIKHKSSIYCYVTTKEINDLVPSLLAQSKSILIDFNKEIAGAQSLLMESSKSYEPKHGWPCPLCTLINLPIRAECAACSVKRPKNSNFVDKKYEDPLKFAGNEIEYKMTKEKGNDLNRKTIIDRTPDIFNITVQPKIKIELPKMNLPKINIREKSNVQLKNYKPVYQKTTSITSPNITKNKYRGVDNYNPHVNKNQEIATTVTKNTKSESVENKDQKIESKKTILSNLDRISDENFANEKNEQKKRDENIDEKTKEEIHPSNNEIVQCVLEDKLVKKGNTNNRQSNHYTELVNLDISDIIPNHEPFECPICFTTYNPLMGIILKNCLHTFCRECIANTIKYSEDAEIKCPYIDQEYSCDSLLSEREIKALITNDEYEQHLAISLRLAENRTANAFHCKTPNCRGWCIYEDNVNEFKCPICQIINCLTCRIIHVGLNCKQYQDRMSWDCDTSVDARRTKDMLAEMIDKGEAMNCPTCQVVLMKKWGCDWLKCTMCKTEICWVTRGVRWGPEGKGDTSGGCKCGVNGVKCHPKCNYCH